MTPEARRFALRVAAKVALLSAIPGGGLMGCGERTSPAAPDDAGAADTDAGAPGYACGLGPWVPLADEPDAAGDTAGEAAGDATPRDAAILDDAGAAAFACCVDVLEAALASDSGVATYFDEEKGNSPSVDRCCHYTLDWLEVKYDVDLLGFAEDRTRLGARGARYACCTRFPSAACESWGPPAPPPALGPARRVARGPECDLRDEVAPHRAALAAWGRAHREAPWAATARRAWRGRMTQEHGSAEVFEALAVQLGDAGLPPELVDRCRAFAEQERRHGVLCGAVVEALGGEARATLEGTREEVPAHPDVGRREAVARNLLAVSCLAETVAVALLAAERTDMPDGPLRALLTRIWADEIAHARFGWRVLAALVVELDDAARARLADYAATAERHVTAHYLARLGHGHEVDGGAVAGLCDGAAARALVRETLTDVVRPRLAALGVERRAT